MCFVISKIAIVKNKKILLVLQGLLHDIFYHCFLLHWSTQPWAITTFLVFIEKRLRFFSDIFFEFLESVSNFLNSPLSAVPHCKTSSLLSAGCPMNRRSKETSRSYFPRWMPHRGIKFINCILYRINSVNYPRKIFPIFCNVDRREYLHI